MKVGRKLVGVGTGDLFSVGLDDGGTVYTWGLLKFSFLPNISHFCAQIQYSKNIAGDNAFGQLGTGDLVSAVRPTPRETGALVGVKIISVVGGYYHTLALDDKGQIYSWGKNANGQLGINSTIDKLLPVKVLQTGSMNNTVVTFISAGIEFSLAVSSEGLFYGTKYKWF